MAFFTRPHASTLAQFRRLCNSIYHLSITSAMEGGNLLVAIMDFTAAFTTDGAYSANIVCQRDIVSCNSLLVLLS